MPFLVFDIETTALPDAAEYLEPAEAPANYKDPVKIAEYIEKERVTQLARSALDLDLCQIVAVGYQFSETNRQVGTGETLTESLLLEDFWNATSLRDRPSLSVFLCGFNIFNFDLPVLIRRSQYLGIPHPTVNLDRYRSPHVDLAQRLSFNGTQRMRSLDFYCRRFGIPCTDTIKGADIPTLVAGGQWDHVRTHAEADVTKTVALAQKLGIIP